MTWVIRYAGPLVAGLACDNAFAEDAQNCFSSMIRFNVCEEAPKIQSAGKDSFLQKISQNITLVSIVAVGARVIFNAVWRLSRQEMEEMQRQGDFTHD